MAINTTEFYKAFSLFFSKDNNAKVGQHIENFHVIIKEAGLDPCSLENDVYFRLLYEYTQNILKGF